MNIITISREFGSGGREFAKHLAEHLGYDYYDQQIIAKIAERHNLDEKVVDSTLDGNHWQSIPFTFSHSFVSPFIINVPQTNILIEQRKVIEEIASLGRNCVIVGRNADVLLSEFKPFDIFVCADMSAKIERCKARADENENLTDKQIQKNIQRIDKNRARTRYIISDGEWGHRKSYDIILNTTGWDLNELAISVADMVKRWAKLKENKE